MSIPNDPVMLLSYINTQLRDNCSSLSDFSRQHNIDEKIIIDKLSTINYYYDEKTNRFN